jgi:hypothetical protein
VPTSRLIRLAVAAVAVAGIVLPAAGASAAPPPCELHWEPFLTTQGLPVTVTVDRPAYWTC